MLKDLNIKIAIVSIAIILTLGVGVALAFTTNNLVLAEDLPDTAILNFNQFLNPANVRSDYYGLPFNTNVNNGLTIVKGTSTQSWVNTHNGIYTSNDFVPYNKEHIYYLNMNYIYYSGLETHFSLYTDNNATALSYITLDGSVSSGYALFKIGEQDYDYFNVFYDNQPRGTYDFSIQPMLVDLTQMFGEGFEPSTLEQVKDYLPLTYYSYTTGTPLGLSYLTYSQAYDKGYKDGYTYSSTDVIYHNNLVNIKAYPGSSIVSSANEDGSFIYSGFEDGFSLVPSSTFIKGRRYTITWDSIVFDGFDYVSFDVVDSNQSFNTYESSSSLNGSISFMYETTYSLSDINIEFHGSDTVSSVIIKNLVISQYSDSLEAFDYGYREGYIDGVYDGQHDDEFIEGIKQEGYVEGVADVEATIPAIKNQYENIGYSKGVEDAGNYTFFSLLSSVVESPLNAVLGMFEFDFLGVNLKNFIMLIVTVCIIISVVRLFMGRE